MEIWEGLRWAVVGGYSWFAEDRVGLVFLVDILSVGMSSGIVKVSTRGVGSLGNDHFVAG